MADADDDERIFMRMTTGYGEKVHVMATHLEHSSNFGVLGLDAEQAHQLAGALRSLATVADSQAEGYNKLLDRFEARIREDEVWLIRRANIISIAKQVALYVLVGIIVWWLGR